jgi:hypothetical protein
MQQQLSQPQLAASHPLAASSPRPATSQVPAHQSPAAVAAWAFKPHPHPHPPPRPRTPHAHPGLPVAASAEVVVHALLAATNLQQYAVLLQAPGVVQACRWDRKGQQAGKRAAGGRRQAAGGQQSTRGQLNREGVAEGGTQQRGGGNGWQDDRADTARAGSPPLRLKASLKATLCPSTSVSTSTCASKEVRQQQA